MAQPHSDLDLFPAFYQFLNDDMSSSATFGYPAAGTFEDLIVPPVDVHNDQYIQQQLVGDELDDVVEVQPPEHTKRAKKVTSPEPGSDAAGGSAKVRAACSNCRSSHVACSHEIPCKRCVEHGLADSCQYLPRKKRTNFKKRKMHSIKEEEDEDSNGALVDAEAALKMEELRRNPPANLFEGGQPDQGLWNATLHQVFGNEYAFPLVNTNIPPQAQPKDYGLALPAYTVESPQSSSPLGVDVDSSNWLAHLIGDSSPSSTSSLPTSPTESVAAQRSSSNSSSGFSSPDSQPSYALAARGWSGQSDMVQLGHMPTTGHTRVAAQSSMIKPPSPATAAPLSPGSVSSRTVNLLQEMKAKNDRLERLLRNALDDIKELKQREKLREQHNVTMQSLVQLQNIGPADEFRKGVPALAMFALSEERHGAILQANETFRNLVGYSFEQLATPGFTCCKLFPERFKTKLCKDYQAIMSGARSSGQDDLVILRGDALEVPVRAFYHIIYDDVGRPLYKMFYAFPLA